MPRPIWIYGNNGEPIGNVRVKMDVGKQLEKGNEPAKIVKILSSLLSLLL